MGRMVRRASSQIPEITLKRSPSPVSALKDKVVSGGRCKVKARRERVVERDVIAAILEDRTALQTVMIKAQAMKYLTARPCRALPFHRSP